MLVCHVFRIKILSSSENNFISIILKPLKNKPRHIMYYMHVFIHKWSKDLFNYYSIESSMI